jgi:hypothetical protein
MTVAWSKPLAKTMDPTLAILSRSSPVITDPSSIAFDFRHSYQHVDTTNIKIEPRRGSNIDEEVYGDHDLYVSLVAAREAYGKMKDYDRVRLESNPFEGIPHKAWIDRAALKIAGANAVLDFIPHITDSRPVLLFTDIAGAPGAFTEYIMWLTNLRGGTAVGTSISLKESDSQWHLNRSRLEGVDESNLLISYGADGSGDITIPENIEAFVKSTIEGGYRDVVVADAGVDADRDPGNQEGLNAKVILGEVLIAIQILARGGSFFLKVYDCYSRYMADIFQLLSRHFEYSLLYKPLSSRPANAERYFVGKGFTGNHVHPMAPLYGVLTTKGTKDEPITGLSSFMPAADPDMNDYLIEINNLHARSQLWYLRYAVEVDNHGGNVTFPVPYSIDRVMDVWGIPRNRKKLETVLDSSPAKELEYLGYIAALTRYVTAKDPALQDTLSQWLRYSASHGASIEATDTKLLKGWASDVINQQTTTLRKHLVDILVKAKVEPKVNSIRSLRYTVIAKDDTRILSGKTQEGHVIHTPQVSPMAFDGFLSPIERKKKHPNLIHANWYLLRAFMLLKRYEGLRLTEDAYRFTWPEKLDVELYATLLTRGTDLFYSPVYDLERPLGAIGYPLVEDGRSWKGKKVGLNLCYVKDPTMKKELIERILEMVAHGAMGFVGSFGALPVLNDSKYNIGHAATPSDVATNVITGKGETKRLVLLYTLRKKKS